MCMLRVKWDSYCATMTGHWAQCLIILIDRILMTNKILKNALKLKKWPKNCNYIIIGYIITALKNTYISPAPQPTLF